MGQKIQNKTVEREASGSMDATVSQNHAVFGTPLSVRGYLVMMVVAVTIQVGGLGWCIHLCWSCVGLVPSHVVPPHSTTPVLLAVCCLKSFCPVLEFGQSFCE